MGGGEALQVLLHQAGGGEGAEYFLGGREGDGVGGGDGPAGYGADGE